MKLNSLPLRLFGRNSAESGEALHVRAAKYERQMDCDDHPESLDQTACSDEGQVAGSSKPNKKCPRQIQFSFVTEEYEELVDDAHAKTKEEKDKLKKEKYKKLKKVGIEFGHFFLKS